MTFDIWASNEEQHEAHYAAFEKIWCAGCLAALIDLFPELRVIDWHRLKNLGFECYMIDTHLDLMLETMPPEWREGQPAITPEYIVSYIAGCIIKDPNIGGWR